MGEGFYYAGVQPKELYCRRITWAEGMSPVDGVGIEITDRVELWDQWLDELEEQKKSEAIELVEVFASATIEWGHDLAPQMLRIMDRISRTLKSSEVADKLGVSSATIQRYARLGWIPHSVTGGGHRRFNLGEVKQALAEKREDSDGPPPEG